jgi:vacuolar protein sorting-associated protein 8
MFLLHTGGETLRDAMATLLSRYLRLAIDNAPKLPAHHNGTATTTNNSSSSGSSSSGSSSRSHYQMLAGVCTEYCAVTDRMDVLFGQLLVRFQEAVSYHFSCYFS